MLIAIDHGNKQIKTLHHTPFTSGLIQSDAPGFGNDVLQYQGKYYTLTNQRLSLIHIWSSRACAGRAIWRRPGRIWKLCPGVRS